MVHTPGYKERSFFSFNAIRTSLQQSTKQRDGEEALLYPANELSFEEWGT